MADRRIGGMIWIKDEELETMRMKLSKYELPVAAMSVLIVLVATLAGPRLNYGMAGDGAGADHIRQTRQIAELRAALNTAHSNCRTLETEFAEASLALKKVQSQLAALKTERDALATQVATATEQARQLEEQLAAARGEAGKLKQSPAISQVTKERDEAIARAKRAEERNRKLTLELHRAGIWP